MANDLQFLDYETVPLTVTTTSASVKFKLPGSISDCQQVMVANEGLVTAFVAFGDSASNTLTITAVTPATTGTVNCTPIMAGETLILTKNRTSRGADTCAAITASGNTNLYFTSGKGF